MAAAWAVFQKDLRSELRTRYALNALIMFALATVLMSSISLGTQLLPGDPLTPLIDAALLWIVLFFAALTGTARAFVQEETAQTAALLRLHAPPLAVLIGKWLFNTLLLAGLTLLTTLVFGLLMSLRVGNLPLLLVVLLLGSIGLATTTTLVAAIIAQANVRSALFAPLAFPLLLPLLVIAVQTTDQALRGNSWSGAVVNVQLLVAYILVTTASAVLVFPLVWEA